MADNTNDEVPTLPVTAAPVGEKLAEAVEAGGGSSRWTDALHELGAIDRATYDAVAMTPTPRLDWSIRALSRGANQSRLWLVIALLLAVGGGPRGRRAAIEGVISIGVTSTVVNLGVKQIFRRDRPDRTKGPFTARHAAMPTSTSFPSGHSASAFAFAHAVGRHVPEVSGPVRLLAGAVAYSRVHVGVHYPGDVVIGALIGESVATVVGAAYESRVPRTS